MKMKRLKQICFIPLMLLCLFIFQIHHVEAASFSVSRSKSSVAPGGTFSVTISVAGAGQFNVSVSNGSGGGTIWVDGSASTTIKAGSSGTTTVTVTAVDVTANDESAVTGSKSVSVSITGSSNNNTGSSGSNSNKNNNTGSSGTANSNKNNTTTTNKNQTTTQKEETNKSSNADLKSLSLSEGDISPKFSASKTTYEYNTNSEVTSVTIKASASDSKATVSGTGKKEIILGSQTFEIVVTAEDGTKKTYTITVNVSEKPKTFVTMDDQKLGILEDISKASVPKGYKATDVTIEDNEVSGWSNEKLGITLVYLADEDDNKNLYIVEDNKVVRKFETYSYNKKSYILLSVPQDMQEQEGLVFGKVNLGDIELDGWTFKDPNHHDYVVVYLLNADGEKVLYTYEKNEQTLQKYVPYE